MSTLTSFLDQIVADTYAIPRLVGETDEEFRFRMRMAMEHDLARDGRTQRLLYMLAKLRVAEQAARTYLPVGLP